jgi:hypothetical protein
VNAAPLGVIVNRIPHRGGNFYYGYGYGYRYGRRTSERSEVGPDGPRSGGGSRPEPGEGVRPGPAGKVPSPPGPRRSFQPHRGRAG